MLEFTFGILTDIKLPTTICNHTQRCFQWFQDIDNCLKRISEVMFIPFVEIFKVVISGVRNVVEKTIQMLVIINI